MQTIIEEKLTQSLTPDVMDVVNESHMHSGPATESHYKVTVVSKQFTDKMLIARHRMVNAALAEELDGKIHALAIHTYTPDEYFERSGTVPESPQCEGGSK